MSSDFKTLLTSAFPKVTWPTIVRAQREGIALADDLRISAPMLAGALGSDLKGHLRRIGVMSRIQTLCDAGDLPFKAEVTQMPEGTWHWLCLHSQSFIAHVARTDASDELPEETTNRQHYLTKNTGDLFDGNIVPIRKLVGLVDRFYAYFTFGVDAAGSLTHSTLGMASNEDRAWLTRTNILLETSSVQPAKAPRAPKVDPKERIRFTEEVEKFINRGEDRGNKS